jgi:hypothetical protein
MPLWLLSGDQAPKPQTPGWLATENPDIRASFFLASRNVNAKLYPARRVEPAASVAGERERTNAC